MKKRLLAMFVTLATLVCLICIFPSAQTAQVAAQADTLQAGYSKVRIDPTEVGITGLPMSGYGNTTERLSAGTLDDNGDGSVNKLDGLFATCVAITDQHGNTLLYFSLDLISAAPDWSNAAKAQIFEALKNADYEVEYGNIIFNASHTHSGPDLSYGVSFTDEELAANALAQNVKNYRDFVYGQLRSVALSAMRDRTPVTMTKGSIKASEALTDLYPNKGDNYHHLSYVRHYKNSDGVIGGSNFGYISTSSSTKMVSDPVETMQLVQFTPVDSSKGDPIVLVNWSAHATVNSTQTTQYGIDNYKKVSSDYVNSLRYNLANAGYRAAFMQGAAGNISPTTTVSGLQNPNTTKTTGWINKKTYPVGYLYGNELAKVALWCLDDENGKMSDNLDTSIIRHVSANFKFDTNSPTDEEAALVNAMLAYTGDTYGYDDLIAYLTAKDTNWAKRTEYYNVAGFEYLKMINSRHQLSNAKYRMYWADHPTSSMTVGVITIGTQLSFVVSGCELFDRYSLDATLNNTTDNDWDDLYDSTYGMPLIMGYTDNGLGYVPNALAYTYNPDSDDYAPGSYESQAARYGKGTGEALIQFYDDLLDVATNPGPLKYQCECGDTLTSGSNGHVCKTIEFLPWPNDDFLPSNGNWYLTKDVVITTQHHVSQTLRLDLNGYTVTHLVSEQEGINAYRKQQDASLDLSHETRVCTVSGSAYVAITDSVGGGKITRDISNLTQAQNEAISNYGLIFLVGENNTATITLYNGTLDATGQVAGGGGCFALLDSNASFKMYGGTLKGGISNVGGVAFVRGNAEFYGGLVTGGTTKDSSGWHSGIGIFTHKNVSGRLTIGGDVEIQGSKLANGSTSNILFDNVANMAENFTVTGNFTGKVGFTNYYPSYNQVVGKSNNATFTSANLFLDNYTTYPVDVYGNDIVLGETKTQCECGGTLASGTYGHVCERKDFRPWAQTTSLPSTGYYYLVNNVTLSYQAPLESELHLDLNGKTVTHKVSAAEGQKALDKKNDSSIVVNARVFYMGYTNYNAICTITDSVGGGKITRDLTNLTDNMKNAIDNYGLIVAMHSTFTGSFTLYNGTLDVTDQVAGGGACIANMSTAANKGTFKMYGGTLKGGRSSQGSCVYSSGKIELYGGTITGGVDTGASGAVYITNAGNLVLGGNANVTGNYRLNGTPSNIKVSSNNFTVRGTYSGTAGLYANLQAGAIVGTSDNAVITGSITGDQNTNGLIVSVSGNNLVVAAEPKVAYIVIDGNITQYDSLAEAIAAYPGGDAVIKLLRDNNENIQINTAVKLDLAGFDLTGNITVNATVQIMDSETDDYTVLDANGYGTIPSTLKDKVSAMDGYVMITEDGKTSFHRLNLDFYQANLRTSSAGIYYKCQFGGDEVVKRNVLAYGTALGAGKAPGFENNTYTRFEGNADWICGSDANGISKNLRNGAILDGILNENNSPVVNRRNGSILVYNQSYVDLADGRRILGECVSFSLKDLMQGTESVYGVDEVFNWDGYLSSNQKEAIMNLYETFKSTMSSWTVPNIKQALLDREDDGVLRVLMIGHSLGVDSTYFFPQVYKAETGKDIVVGTLYHSGCRLGEHAYYMNNDLQEYAYLEYDTSKDTAWRIYENSAGVNGYVTHYANQAHDIYIGSGATANGTPNKYGVTMEFGITRQDWDIVVMQAGVFEAANVKDTQYFTVNIANDIAKIQSFVKNNDINTRTTPKFAWNVTWSAPEDKTLATGSYDTLLDSEFGNSSVAMYNAIISTLKNIVPTSRFDYIFHSGTSIQNAKTVLTDKEVYRDTIHASDFSRLMVAYTWYCELTGTDIADCKITSIGSALRFTTADRDSKIDFVLTAAQKATLINCVKNTLTNPLKITQ